MTLSDMLVPLRSVNTTVAGVVAVIVVIQGALALLLDGNPATNPDWNTVIPAVVAGIGLILARDGGKTSADVGAGK
jgi:hypothetical protein